MKRLWGLALLIAAGVGGASAPAPASAAILGMNLVVNGDAEAGGSSPSGFTVVPVPGWTTSSNFTVVGYAVGAGFPVVTDPGPAVRGLNFFAGGPSTPASSAFQVVDVSSESALIDAGQVAFDLAGYLGGYLGQEDSATFTAFFRDGIGGGLGSAAIGPVNRADRANLTGTIFRQVLGLLPTGTRSVKLQLDMTRHDGDYDDGYADNLSFSLTATGGPAPDATIPEPTSLAIFSLGLALVGVARRRNMK